MATQANTEKQKVLISWFTDFKWDSTTRQTVIKEDGPNFDFHKKYYEHDKHILLSSASENEDDGKYHLALKAASLLRRAYKNQRTIETKFLGIPDEDIVNLEVIKSMVEPVLLENLQHDIDIFFSPGTSIMQITWFLLHQSLGLKNPLIQTYKDRDNEIYRSKVEFDQSKTLINLTIRNIRQDEIDEEVYNTGPTLKELYKKAKAAAGARNVNVLILGETGTGKEMLARYVHKYSPRFKPKEVNKNENFYAINCSAFSDNLLESRLFGYVKGAFTDAKQDRAGLFEEADGGTLFLDEIGDISPYMQQSLLRVLQEKEILRVGGNKPIEIDVRIVAATNRDLQAMCEEGKFRWDLYYRLAVVEFELPPLRNWKKLEERTALINQKLKKKAKDPAYKQNKPLVIEKEVKDFLSTYSFPGNIRELENLIENLYVFCEDTVTIDDIPKRYREKKEEMEESFFLRDAEKKHILRVTEYFGGPAKKIAEILGISYNNYVGKLKQYGKK